MKTLSLASLTLLSLLPPCSAFIGITIKMYVPTCLYACRAVISDAKLDCPLDMQDMPPGGMSMMSMGGSTITPECRSENAPFLTTLAYCVNQTCTGQRTSTLQKVWEDIVSSGDAGPESIYPILTYQGALDLITAPPLKEYDDSAILNVTVITPMDQWTEQYRTLQNFESGEGVHSRVALALLFVGALTPVVLTLLDYLPFSNRISLKFKPYLIYPATIGKHHIEPILRVCNPPTLGQTWYILLWFILNIVLSAVGYRSVQPNAWFPGIHLEMTSKIGARTGVIAMALLPLTFLFGGRNHLILWLANWDHSTYMLLHRWIARTLTLHIILHSVLFLYAYVLSGDYPSNLVQPYWIWGCVATVASVAMCVQGVLRRFAYELFIALHVLLAVFVLAGTWYHLIYRFDYKWGYHYWMFLCFAVWAFDRLIRVVRIVKAGWCQAIVTKLGENITRIDIAGVRWDSTPGKHAYLYFPLVNRWSPWQSHPFSVIPSQLLHRAITEEPIAGDKTISESASSAHLPSIHSTRLASGITLYIKGEAGLTRRLFDSPTSSLATLVEGPYGTHTDILRCDRLVLISGGIGITGVLPYSFSHINSKLYWSVRGYMAPLVADIEPALDRSKEREIRISSRFDVREVVAHEASACQGVLGVLVCGPPSMCDDVRAAVVAIAKDTGAGIRLQVEAFSW